jgi:dTDP-4-dehydrorhamnose reductase
MKVLITGAGGLLGRCVIAEFARHHSVVDLVRADLDISDAAAIAEIFNREKSDVVINCAAMTNVDACETDRDGAFRDNADSPGRLAKACSNARSHLIHVSTDYIFDGTKDGPYAVDDTPNPISVYGASKLAGEEAIRSVSRHHAIVRVAGLFGSGGKNFASKAYDLLTTPGTVKGISDNHILPSYAADVAFYLRMVAENRVGGTMHAVNAGPPCSWLDFATHAKSLLGDRAKAEIVPVTEAELNRPAKRPMRSVLAHTADPARNLPALRDWREALAEFLGGSSS